MGFKMGYNKEDLNGAPPVPAGWYLLRFEGFSPKASKLKDGETEPSSFNYRPSFTIVSSIDNPADTSIEGRKINPLMNSNFAPAIADFVHSTGMPLEEVQDENAGTEAASFTLPGVFEDIDKFPSEPEKWGKYLGPLTNKTFEAEVAITSYNNKDRNEIRQFKCAVPGCTENHRTNLIKS
jgi:hypothetical protein